MNTYAFISSDIAVGTGIGIVARNEFDLFFNEDLGMLLRFLTASKKGASVLELGTGTGLALSWILDSLDDKGCLVSIKKNDKYLNIAASFFGKDPRVELIHQDAAFWIDFNKNNQFDLIFADTWVGKFTHLDLVLAMVKPGGFYVVDDLNRQLNWPEGHQDQVILLLDKLKSQKDFYAFPIDMGTSLFVLCRKRA